LCKKAPTIRKNKKKGRHSIERRRKKDMKKNDDSCINISCILYTESFKRGNLLYEEK